MHRECVQHKSCCTYLSSEIFVCECGEFWIIMGKHTRVEHSVNRMCVHLLSTNTLQHWICEAALDVATASTVTNQWIYNEMVLPV